MITEIINEDGSRFDPPYNTEYQQLQEKYPRCEHWGYNCMYCNKCMLGEYFKPSNDDEARILKEHGEEVHKYLLTHNPSLRGMLY